MSSTNGHGPKRAILYARVSTAPEGGTLAAHLYTRVHIRRRVQAALP
jgi:hypothetical protein